MGADPAPGSSLRAALSRWPAAVVRFRWPIALLWLVVVLIFAPGAKDVEKRLEVAARMPSGQAEQVRDDLERRFRSPFTDRVLLVVEGIPGPATPDGREALEAIVAAVKAVPGVAGTLSSLDSEDSVFVGRERGFLLVVGLDAGAGPVEDLLPRLRETSEALKARLRLKHPDAWLGWTGEAPLNFDLRRASSVDARTAEAKVLPATLLLLLFVFGSVVAALLPLGVGVLSIVLSLGVTAVLARFFTLSILIQTLASMIGLGLGIDYALLTVCRFRESLASGQGTGAAAEETVRRAGWTILLSAFPVSIGFAALLTIPLSELRSIGLAGFLVTLFSLLLSVTLLPAVLSLLGPRIEALRVRRIALVRSARGSEAWRRWGLRVISRPVLALTVVTVPLLVLAAQAARLDTAMPRGDWLPRGSESVRAYHSLETMGRSNVMHSLRVVLDFPEGVTLDSPLGWTAAGGLLERLRADRRVDRVQCLPAILAGPEGVLLLPMVPAGIRRSLEAADGSAALFEVIPAAA
jgi:putative drug exporter of the RND superfamily